MATSSCGFDSFLTIFDEKIVLFRVMSTLFLLTLMCSAQQFEQLPDAPAPQLLAQVDQPPVSDPPTSPADSASVTIPAGTRLQLVLTHPVNSNSTSHGDQVFAQTTAPIIVGDQVVIPGGTYVQGKVEKLTRRGSRAEMLMQSVSLVFPNGYIAHAGGPVNIESEEWTAWNNPEGRTKVAIVLAPIVGLGLGMGIGAAMDKPHTVTLGGGSMPVPPGFPPVPPLPLLTMTENTHKGLAIGGIVGGIAGGITALTLAARSHQFYIEASSPLTMSLPQAVTLTRVQVDDANRAAATAPPPAVPQRPVPPINQGNSAPNPPTGPASCSAGQEWCHGQCADTIAFINDSSNCGRCGNQCSISESCTGGSCSCAPGYSSCMGQCVNDASFISDSQNCGRCGNSCSIGESCPGGTCMKIGP
jgi:hypothetical protein